MKFFFVITIILIFAGCAVREQQYTRFNYETLDYFDTLTSILGYAQSQEEFDYFTNIILAELGHFNRHFCQFNDYEGISNIKTTNTYAGIRPVYVHPDVIAMLEAGIDAYDQTNGIVNIAIGPVTNIWREYISRAEEILPSTDDLLEAAGFTNISDVIVDGNSVFLRYHNMYLDVGSIAKGFAIERAAQAALDAGFEAFTLSVGGDVRLASGPRSGNRDTWGVGILDPNNPDEILEAIFVTDTAVFTSGDYLRYYTVNNAMYHHIIDPRTLMPAIQTRSVTVIYPCGITAEILSLAAFILGAEESAELLADVEVFWVLP
ncbi:MAG: FAD:protein FMN transferase [Defluviitaleaceae bacterium]|nr:FAD:protein FMN transferase [Defluviitaleaceae bacterium]